MKDTRFELLTTQRHLRLLFFIEKEYEHSKLMNLFNHNRNIWGGRYNPIIPVDDAGLSDKWHALLPYLDPDYIYCTPQINIEDIKVLCRGAQLNPIEIRVLEDDFRYVEGVSSSYLFPLFNYPITFIKLFGQNNLPPALKDYYSLNYMIDDKAALPYIPMGKFGVKQLSGEGCDKIHYYIIKEGIIGLRRFAQHHTSVDILRAKEYLYDAFEIIIAKDNNSFDDFIYFWNRSLYRDNLHLQDQLIITLEQFELLMSDEYFGEFLDQQDKREIGVRITSFSVDETELNKIKDRLAKVTKRCNYQIKIFGQFPFEVEDAGGANPRPNGERPYTEACYNDGHLFNIPKLSFENNGLYHSEQWAMDVVIRTNNRNTIVKFPYTRKHDIGLSRTNKEKDMCVLLKSDVSAIDMNLPDDYSLIRQLVQAPKLINEKGEMIYEIGYNDCSYRLREFLNLFDFEFHYFEEFFFDKFWWEIFFDLSSNTRIEGDCFTLAELFDNCIKKMKASAFKLGKAKQTRLNPDNLRHGLIRTVQELCDSKIVRPGYIFKCKYCSSKTWYSIDEISNQVACKGCSNLIHFRAETQISYKLNSLIKNNIAIVDKNGKIKPDGNLTVIKTLNYFSKAYHHFVYVPQLNIYEYSRDRKLISDLDLVCIVDGRLHIGECKHKSSLFSTDSNKSLLKLISVAEKIKPEVIVLACTEDDSNNLRKAKNFVEGQIYSWEWKPEVKTHTVYIPDKYEFDSYKFWKD